jgi:hypothetical protein
MFNVQQQQTINMKQFKMVKREVLIATFLERSQRITTTHSKDLVKAYHMDDMSGDFLYNK